MRGVSSAGNTATPKGPDVRYFSSRESVGTWDGLAGGFGTLIVLISIAGRSFVLTLALLAGTVAVWYLGHWALAKSCYFITSTGAGFRDSFRAREVQFEEIRSVTKTVGSSSSALICKCATRTVTIPLDPTDEAWFLALKAELSKRAITVSTTAFGFTLKE